MYHQSQLAGFIVHEAIRQDRTSAVPLHCTVRLIRIHHDAREFGGHGHPESWIRAQE